MEKRQRGRNKSKIRSREEEAKRETQNIKCEKNDKRNTKEGRKYTARRGRERLKERE